MQVDNSINEEMPVLLGAKVFFDKHVNVHGRATDDMKFNLSHAYRNLLASDLKEEERDRNGHVAERTPFLRASFMISKKTQEGKLGAIIRYDSIYFAMQEIFLQVETTILKDNFKFVLETLKVFGRKEEQTESASRRNFSYYLEQSREQTCQKIDAS